MGQLSKEELRAVHRKNDLDRKGRIMLREVLWQVILVLLMAWVIAGNQSAEFHQQNQHLTQFYMDEFPEVGASLFTYCIDFVMLQCI